MKARLRSRPPFVALACAIGAALALVGCAVPRLALDPQTTAARNAATAAPSPEARIRADVAYLADDAREGRETGTPGYDAAARYVAGRFEALGLAPAGPDRGWFQPVPLERFTRVTAAAALSPATPSAAAQTLTPGEDFVISRTAAPVFSLEAEAVFVGYGVAIPDIGRDDYAGLNVTGKIVVAFDGAPAGLESEAAAFHRSSQTKMHLAAERGAVGFVSIPTKASSDIVAARAAAPSRPVIALAEAAGSGLAASAGFTAAGAEKLFAGAAQDYAALAEAEAAQQLGPDLRFALPRRLALSSEAVREPVASNNVIAVIPGADPALRGEALVLTAHLDHEGVRDPRGGGEDRIHNGALDNAIGVGVLLEVARATAAGPPPRRTIVFAALTGEEKGLLGAAHLASNPPARVSRMVANLNIDMPLALFPFSDVIAFGGARSSLGGVFEEEAGKLGVAVIPDPMPEQGIFTRSDHYRFVEAGVPSIFPFIGFGGGGEAVFRDFMKRHYHQPSDDITLPIDYAAAARFAALNAAFARRIADADAAPTWTPGDMFAERYAAPGRSAR